jgi:hypothetical protein
MDRHAHWCAVYQDLTDRGRGRVGSGYSEEAYDTFPRYHAMDAILTEIETLDPDSLPECGELVELLTLAGEVAESMFTRPPQSPIGAKAIADERRRFVDYVLELVAHPPTDSDVPPLPYRRVLSGDEVAALWVRARERWGCDGSYFFPLADRREPSLRAFFADAFDQVFPASRLRNILGHWGVARLYELREHGDANLIVSADAWEPCYNGAEGFWFTDSLEWLMYASHENSITTGGALTDVVLAQWPHAAEHEHTW